MSIEIGRIYYYGSVQRRHRLQNRRISQPETSTIDICDVVNIIALQHARVSGDQNVTSPVFYNYGDILIYPNE